MASSVRFWSSTSTEPKRKYRWLGFINFHNPESTIDYGPQAFAVKSFTHPVLTLDNEKIINNFTSETRIVTKNYRWENCTISIHDMERGYNASGQIYGWLQSLGYKAVQNIESLSKLFTNIQNNTFDLTLSHIDAHGQITESWSFIEPQPISIDFGGELSYDSDETLAVTLEITYVAAKYDIGGTVRSQ